MTRTCVRCDAPVLVPPNLGFAIDAEPVPMGVFLPDDGGRRKTVREAVAGRAGHHRHRCPVPVHPSLLEAS